MLGNNRFWMPHFLIFSLATAPAASQDDDDYMQEWRARHEHAMVAVEEFAQRICVPEGSSIASNSVASLTGALEQLRVYTTESFSQTSYIGALQSELTGWSRDPAGCRAWIIDKWANVFLPPPPATRYSVLIASEGSYVDNRYFGPIDIYSSDMRISINDGDSELFAGDEPVNMLLKLPEGDHRFTFDIFISSAVAPVIVEQICEGWFSVTGSGTFRPFISVVMAGSDGYISECRLTDD